MKLKFLVAVENLGTLLDFGVARSAMHR